MFRILSLSMLTEESESHLTASPKSTKKPSQIFAEKVSVGAVPTPLEMKDGELSSQTD